ncbi:hypothetical protein Py04_0737 [Pyrococcus sp. ST04]|nr:hypothetical protein Py04_0737 [Pyrococcus sp. ST04]
MIFSVFQPVAAMYGTKTIDSSLTEWLKADVVAIGKDSGLAGANLDKLYIAWDENYLYIAIKTNNSQSWDVAYGIGIDIDPGAGTGYKGTSDAWGRKISFGNNFGIDYEIYFWWSGSSGITADNFITWTGEGWDYKSISEVGGEFAYSGDSSNGLQTLEIRIPWSAFGEKPEKIGIIAWIAGGDGSSAVDSLPVDPTIDYSNIGSEWTDDDTFTNLAVVSVSSKVIDGDLSDWTENEKIPSLPSGLPGADIEALYVSWDADYLYIAIRTNNSQSWDVAYGIGIDVDPGSDNGYSSAVGETDAWGRKITFSGFAIDYEIYFWWSGSSGITADNFITWTGEGWDYKSISEVGGEFAYTGDTTTGLQTLEIKIPWSALGGFKERFAIIAWVTGGDGSSAVDTAPYDPAIDYSNIGSEWTDEDVFSMLATTFEFPDLTVTISGPTVVGVNREAEYSVHVRNLGDLPISETTVKVYINNTLYKNWTISVDAREEKTITFNWTPTSVGDYTIKAVVDEENSVLELNENNNEYSLDVSVVWVGKVDVDGNPDDWPKVSLTDNSYEVTSGYFIWKDAVGDQRKDKDPYLPGKSSEHSDLVEFGVTKDEKYVYFLLMFENMSNIKIGDNGATFVAIPIDYKAGGVYWFAGDMDTKTIIPWDIQIVVNLASSEYSGEKEVVAGPGSSKSSLFYILDSDGNIIQVSDAIVGINLDMNTIEIRIPLSAINNSETIKLQVATAFSYGPAVWNFGDPFANDDISDIVDTISEASTEEELKDNIPDYYIKITFNAGVERGEVINYLEERLAEERRRNVNAFMDVARYYGLSRFQTEYAKYSILLQNLSSLSVPAEFTKEIEELTSKVYELERLYNEAVRDVNSGKFTISTAVKIYRAYTGLIRINAKLQRIIEIITSKELEWAREMQELKKELKKNIDGNLTDWSVKPLVEDTTGFGQEGADLKALYVDYDDNFLYLALRTNNKASWRIAYGISLDYKEGGYTTGGDAWGRNIDFTRGIDAQIYLFWNGEFFGSPGTNNITSANLAIWRNGTWEYLKLDKYAFYAYSGGDDGLQTLEIAIPWKVLGGKPEKIYIVAYITGQGIGDSAVDALPDQPALHDSDNEWTDFDEFTNFAEVIIK